jgi:hypothetical protein
MSVRVIASRPGFSASAAKSIRTALRKRYLFTAAAALGLLLGPWAMPVAQAVECANGGAGPNPGATTSPRQKLPDGPGWTGATDESGARHRPTPQMTCVV